MVFLVVRVVVVAETTVAPAGSKATASRSKLETHKNITSFLPSKKHYPSPPDKAREIGGKRQVSGFKPDKGR